MASTRNKNTTQDYKLEKRKIFNSENYIINNDYALSNRTRLPDFGLNMPHMPRDKLANNAVNIESALFGIGSTNLVEPQQPVHPEIIDNGFDKSILDKLPLIVPDPLQHNKNDRPYFLP